MSMNEDCELCLGEGWVCENHPDTPWERCSCNGAGDPCRCNSLFDKER